MGAGDQRIILAGNENESFTTEARLPGIAAAVAQCPFTDAVASLQAMNPATAVRITALAVRDLIGARAGKPPLLISTAGKPGEVALNGVG